MKRPPNQSVGVELFSYVNTFYWSINLHGFSPLEMKTPYNLKPQIMRP